MGRYFLFVFYLATWIFSEVTARDKLRDLLGLPERPLLSLPGDKRAALTQAQLPTWARGLQQRLRGMLRGHGRQAARAAVANAVAQAEKAMAIKLDVRDDVEIVDYSYLPPGLRTDEAPWLTELKKRAKILLQLPDTPEKFAKGQEFNAYVQEAENVNKVKILAIDGEILIIFEKTARGKFRIVAPTTTQKDPVPAMQWQ